MFLGGGSNHFLFIPLPEEMFQFQDYFSKGFKPPTRSIFLGVSSCAEGAPHFRLNSGVGRCVLAFIPEICWGKTGEFQYKTNGILEPLFFPKVWYKHYEVPGID